jgi:molybdopterin-guanine dinucleotide biosynthesis protein A
MVIPGVVLAGGRSTRMGRDKALVQIDGVPMALRVASLLVNSGCSPVQVAGRQSALHQLGVKVIPDPPSQAHHPLLGVASALGTFSSELVLFAPCDLVNLEIGHIKRLLSEQRACVATVDGQVHPLFAVIPVHMQDRAAEFARAGRSARDFVSALPKVELPSPNLNDANRPMDLPR